MRLPHDGYLAGRIIIAEPPREFAPGPSCILIYVYAPIFAEPLPDLASLTTSRLLIAPEWINRKPWTIGLFRTVAHHELRPTDLLRQHCFADPVPRFGVPYRDERGGPLLRRSEPCGEWGLAHYGIIDDAIARAMVATGGAVDD